MRDILIVEDGIHERDRLEKLFSEADYTVTGVESVTAAEKLLNIEQFRLAIIDIGLGDKSGSYLFDLIRRSGKIQFVIIHTGNPSVHLKQRFLDDGAVAYVVKASAESENASFLERVRGLLGTGDVSGNTGIPLEDFLRLYVPEASRELFLDANNDISPCASCGATSYVVSFGHTPQLPPTVQGLVICGSCGKEMDPKVG